jgi:iron(III) transport system permease protein
VTIAAQPAEHLPGSPPASGRASRWPQPNYLLIVCVAIGAWLVLVPVAALLLTAFTEDTGLGFGAFTFDNFVEAYSSARILRLIGNSLIYAAGTTAVTFLIGGFVAWAVERTDAPGGALFHNLALLSFAIPGLLMAMAWIFVLSPNIGWVNALLKSEFGLTTAPLNIY